MKKEMKWGLAALILLLGIAAVFIFLDQNAELQQLEKETAESDKQRQERNKPQETPQVQPPPQKAYVHADGTFHVGEHDDPIETPPPPEFTPSPIQIPEGITDPDVAAAWERLDYIAKNPYAWGGVFSPRATELIAELMPPPVLIDEEHGEEVYALMEELIAQGDPRAAEVIITTICDGSMSSRDMYDALVAIGPPAVPYILPYLEKVMVQGGYVPASVFRSLTSIAAAHRDDLGGIVEHILIPKFTTIAADEDFSHYHPPLPREAEEALDRIQKLLNR